MHCSQLSGKEKKKRMRVEVPLNFTTKRYIESTGTFKKSLERINLFLSRSVKSKVQFVHQIILVRVTDLGAVMRI